jgi:septal ring factor EnvC (AmiA/AmiB activator)
MRTTIPTAFLLLLGVLPAARADIYMCIDSQGRKELTDTKKANCKALDLPNSFPAPTGRPAPAAPALAPANFPRVDSNQQKVRDNERREILADELRSEEKKLAELKKEYNGGEPERQGNEKNYAKYQERVAQMKDNLSRSEKNIEALKREMATIK